MKIDAKAYAVEEILRDGHPVRIRAIRADDKQLLLEHFHQLSARSVYFRFFRAKKRLTDDELRRFTEVDFVTHVALVVTIRAEGEDRIVGVGRFICDEQQRSRAEVAFSVIDEYQGRGVGTLLLEHLAEIARANGIEEFEADALGENNRMLEVFAKSGFTVRRSTDAGVVHLAFPTAETEQLLQASLQRERRAAAQSVRAILDAHSVAVIGASRREGSIGAALLANIRNGGFKGPIYPVNPHADEVQGLPAFPSVDDISTPVDLAVVAVPAAGVEETVRACARRGVRGVVVISAGFAEVSAEGREAERRLRDFVRDSGMRMVGPNCMGILNTDPEISLNATFAASSPRPGNVAMLSQSGALGQAILDYVQRLDIGISTFVSVGNKADVSGNDLISYWSEDPRTEVILLYLESFGNPRKFGRIVPDVARRKPIVAVKSGRSAAGSRAASSHSAALASLDVAVDALFEQAGVIRTNTLEELFDVATLLSSQPVPLGPRVGVVTNAGGPGILLADACEARGLKLPEMSAAAVEKLRAFLPREAGLTNPVDMIASATPEHYARTMEIVGAESSIDAMIAIYIPVLISKPEEIAAGIAQGAALVPPEKPVLTVFISSRGAPQILSHGPRGRLPAYSFPENAAIALEAAERYGRWRSRPQGRTFALDRFAQSAIRAVVEQVLAGSGGNSCWVPPRALATVLKAAGIEYAHFEETSAEEAGTAAERLGYPLVAKAIAPGVVHKSDVGGVIMGLEAAAEVEEAVAALAERMKQADSHLEGILLQREIQGGVEALVGVTSDPTFGPLLVCGMGGVLVELLRDVSFRLPPVSDVDAGEMLSRLRSSQLLDGYRGSPPGDRGALIDVIMRISAVVEAVPELTELDLNPVKVLAPGKGAIVVDARMRVGALRR